MARSISHAFFDKSYWFQTVHDFHFPFIRRQEFNSATIDNDFRLTSDHATIELMGVGSGTGRQE